MKKQWIILDWAGNHKFTDKTFRTISAASDYLAEQVEILYPETKNDGDAHNEQMGEYQFITKDEYQGL